MAKAAAKSSRVPMAKAAAKSTRDPGTSSSSSVPPVLLSSVTHAPTPQQLRAVNEFQEELSKTQRAFNGGPTQHSPTTNSSLDEVIDLQLKAVPSSSSLVTVGLDTRTPPVKSNKSKSPYVFRSSEQVARLLNLQCEMREWLACPHPDVPAATLVVVFGPSQLEKLQKLLESETMRVGFGLRLAVTHRHDIGALRQIYATLIHFGICCAMLSSGNWIHVGGRSNRLAMAEVLSPNKSKSTVCTVGASMLTTLQCVSAQGLFHLQISPATFRVVKPDFSSRNPVDLQHSRCVLLPHLSEAAIVGYGAAPNPHPGLQSKEDLIRYWRYLHGYELPDDAAERSVQVQFPRGSLVLTYPLGCVWANNWTYLPAKTAQFGQRLNQEVKDTIQEILEEWSHHSGLVVELRNHGVNLAAPSTSSTPHKASDIAPEHASGVNDDDIWNGLLPDVEQNLEEPAVGGQRKRGRPQKRRP
ncbi:hypothetical protein FOL47_001060 [Perkinsus chesapeaki]|uniref:DUF4708 domain-containing protein n=1 Tax=Perkinsus chesapeaki TaxID=330153 RepID=A0A7J6MK90_PERCH|nr:hypothetical protein FOL47_001060 [Perkinsus chesapeaki]